MAVGFWHVEAFVFDDCALELDYFAVDHDVGAVVFVVDVVVAADVVLVDVDCFLFQFVHFLGYAAIAHIGPPGNLPSCFVFVVLAGSGVA